MRKNFMILGLGVGVIISAVAPVVLMMARVFAEAEMVEAAEIVESEMVKDDEADEADENDENDENETNDAEITEEEIKMPQFYIKAVNPGYKIDGINNVGEMIEIARVGDPDTTVSLAGLAVGYTNSSGNYSLLSEFPEYSYMTGESILLRLASSPGAELANSAYSKTLAMKGGLNLTLDGEVIDEVCWTGKEGCYKAFSSTKPTTLVRNLETGGFEHLLTYEPTYEEGTYYAKEEEVASEVAAKATPQCRDLQFSEILSYYETTKSEQFIEFYNAGSNVITLDGCKVRYKNKKYMLGGTLEPEEYLAYYPNGFSLTKNPTNANKLEIIDTDEAVTDTLEYPNGQRKGTAYAWLGFNQEGRKIWKTTYAPTPGAPNNYQEFKSCEVGKVINKATGNCVKVTNVVAKVCKEGYYLNVLTGRCNKVKVTTEKTCKEGYYLNPETNRCRKIKDNTGADYNLEPENYEGESSFVALYAVLGVLGVGAGYLVWEFRKEIAKLGRKILRKE